MKQLIALLIILFSLSASFSHAQDDVDAYMVSVGDIIPIFREFEEQRIEESFTAFIADIDEPQDLNLLFSIENGRPGFDWVLRAPKNISDQGRFVSMAESMGFQVVVKKENDFDYLRVEVNDSLPPLKVQNSEGNIIELKKELYLALLCSRILTDLYGLDSSDEIGLYAKRVSIGGKQF